MVSLNNGNITDTYQSTPFPYPFLVSISGAIYSLVPHRVRALSRSPISLADEKYMEIRSERMSRI
jgi:hypothetical protein